MTHQPSNTPVRRRPWPAFAQWGSACQGHDTQLEKAVEVIVDQLKKNPLPTYKRPEYPNYHQALPK